MFLIGRLEGEYALYFPQHPAGTTIVCASRWPREVLQFLVQRANLAIANGATVYQVDRWLQGTFRRAAREAYDDLSRVLA